MNPKTIHKTHAATSSRQAAFNSRETASRLRAALACLLFAVCLVAAFTVRGSVLGPIFPLEGGTQLATRPDGTTFIVETFNDCVEPAHVLYREIRVGKIEFGATNQMPFQVSATITSPGCRFPATHPDIAVNSTNAVIAYVDKEAVIVGDPDEYGIYYSLVDTNGSPTNALMLAGGAESWIDEWVATRVAMNQAGHFAMVWFDQSYTLDHWALGRIFDANGQPIGNTFTLNDQRHPNGYYAAYNAAAAIAPDGSSIYVWEDAFLSKGSAYVGYEGVGHDIYARLVDAAGNPVGTQFRVNTTINCRHSDAEIAMATNGSFVVVWRQSSSDADGIYGQRLDAAGNRLGPELRISPYIGTDPQVAMAADGRFVVAWQGQDGEGSGIFAQRFLADGSFYGNALWVNEGATNSQNGVGQLQPLLGIADDGTFIVKWIEYTNNFSSVNNFARWIAWDATNQTQIFGPWVQSMSPAYSVAAPTTNVNVTFNRLMNAATFVTTNAQLIDPLGRIVPITSVQTTNDQTFKLGFAPQQLPGRYQVKVGPDIQDANGVLMDQNSNGIKGEPTDAFVGHFILTASVTANFPITEGFESGPDGLVGWSIAPGPGTISIATNNAPHGGTNHLIFTTPPLGGNSQSATLVVNLSGQTGQTNLFLEFYGMQDWAPFFVELSGDGQNWYPLAQLNGQYGYAEYFFDLDQAAATNGVAIDGDVYVRFRHLNTSDYFASTSQAFIDDVRVMAGDLVGPKIAGHNPTQWAASNSALNTITVSFDEPIDPASFTDADVSLFNPQGDVVSPVSVAPVGGSGNTQFNLTFPSQTVRGTYRLTVGPNITDASGNLMNQNGNYSNGEPGDFYKGTLEYAPTVWAGGSAPVLYAEDFENWSSQTPTYWSFHTYQGLQPGTISTTNSDNPHGGTNHLHFFTPPHLTPPPPDEASQWATLVVDLSSQTAATNLFLDFWARGSGPLVVELSGDGQTWYPMLSAFLPGYPDYLEYTLDLDAAAATNGVALDADVYLRFRQENQETYSAYVWGLFLDNVRVVAGDLVGPKVTGHSPTQWAASNSALNTITVSFDEPIDPASFTGADVSLFNPQGDSVTPISVAPVGGSGNTQFNLTFQSQTIRGTYRLTVGPNIADASGNLLNQNGNYSNGEAGDFYKGTLEYAPTLWAGGSAPVLYAEDFENWSSQTPTYWSFHTYQGLQPGTISATNLDNPHGGTNHLNFYTPPHLTPPPPDEASQWATLVVDLSSQTAATNLFLDFWAKGAGPLVVELSGDGQTWYPMLSAFLPGYPDYLEYTLDLDAAAATNGVALDADVYLRFRQENQETYYAYVWGLYLDNVRILAGVQPPSIVTQPQSQTASTGSNVTFSVTANGTAPLGYQWRFNGINVPGATNYSLALYDVQPTNAGNYTVTVSNIFSSVTSSNATLTVFKLRVPPLPGLVSWWRAENNAVDEIGYNDGSMVNGVTFTNAMVGRGFAFTGGTDYVGLPQNLFPFPTSGTGNAPFSFELWFKTSAGGVILGQQNTAPFSSPSGFVPGLYIGTDGKLYAQMFWKGFADQTVSATAVNDGSFHHVAVSYDGANEVVYLDGLAIGSKPFTQQAYAGSYEYQLGTGFTPGWPAGNGGWYSFTGIVDEPALYNRALSASEVRTIYEAGSLGKSQPVLQSAMLLPDGRFQLTLTAEPGSLYIIQASTNLTTWIPIATNVIPVSGILPITDPDATNYSRRFYRAVQFNNSLIAPVLGVPTRIGNGQFQFQLSALIGSTYVIQASTNLVNWIPITIVVIPASGATNIIDPYATNYSRRFYRAVLYNDSLVAPGIAQLARLGTGQFQFHLSGMVGASYVVQASTNLATWTPIATNAIPDGGLMTFTDPFATNYTRRFYRAVSQ